MKLKVITHAHVLRLVYPLRKKISIFGVSLVLIFLHLAEYRWIRSISPYLVQIRENIEKLPIRTLFCLSDFVIKTSSSLQVHTISCEMRREQYDCGELFLWSEAPKNILEHSGNQRICLFSYIGCVSEDLREIFKIYF